MTDPSSHRQARSSHLQYVQSFAENVWAHCHLTLATTERPLLEQFLETLSRFAFWYMFDVNDDDMLTIARKCGGATFFILSHRQAYVTVCM